MEKNNEYVFVYGTLRQGQSNHQLLNDAILVSEQANVNGKLYDTGEGYPALLLNQESSVFGEIYSVTQDTLQTLDILEGYKEGRESNLYYRCKKEAQTDNAALTCWVYVIDETYNQRLGEEIPFQDWSVHQWYESFQQVKYFAYGSCMDTDRIEKAGMIDHFSNDVQVGKLAGYRFAYSFPLPDGGRADIIEADQAEYVEGIVYSLPKDAIDYLFKREGVYTQFYRPTFVTIEIDGKQQSQVLTFTVIDKHPCSAPPEHYATEILRGAKGRLSDSYMQKLNKKLTDVGYSFSE